MDPQLEQALQAAAVQQQAEQMLKTVLQQTMRQPAVVHHASTTLVDVAGRDEDDVKLLMVALPNGERWDIELSVAAQRQIVHQLGGVILAEGA